MRRRDQHGFVLPEVLLVMVIGTLLLGATFLTFQNFIVNSNENNVRTATAEAARNALEIQARQLRNLARRITTGVIDTVGPDELIFQTSDPTRTWVRYCLDTTDPSNGTLWQQNQSLSVSASGAPVTPAMRAGCPSASGWSNTTQVATNVVNRIGGRNRPVFSYQCATGGSACTATTTTFDQIIGITATLYVDTKPVDGPGEERVSTGVYLRNQNQAPVAEMSVAPVSGLARTVFLNGSGSTDFEQRTLRYYWFEGTMPTSVRCDLPPAVNATTAWGGTLIGRDLTVQYTWPGAVPATGSTRRIGLVVCDPGDRASALAFQDVTIPA